MPIAAALGQAAIMPYIRLNPSLSWPQQPRPHAARHRRPLKCERIRLVRFVADEVTPPHGLTIFDAIGQWRDPNSDKLVCELGKLVEIVLIGKGDDRSALRG